jgi:cytochrome c oxidase subunit 2
MSRFGLLPVQASTVAAQVDALFFFLIGVSVVFSFLIAGLIVYFMLRYRRRQADERPAAIANSLRLEVAWTAVPFVLVMGIFLWGASVFATLRRAPADAMQVNVVGKQWMWKLQHMEGRREINELHVPVGRPVRLVMTSEDVIHSFFVPAFRIKQDTVPGRYTTAWFEATAPGTYHLFCAEYCGTLHSGMIGRVVVMEPAAFQDWLSGGDGQAWPVAEAGAALFERQGCVSCHVAGDEGRGPWLAGVAGTRVVIEGGRSVLADDAYLRESIMNPRARIVRGYEPIMPAYQGLLTEEQVMELIAYIKSLGEAPTS